jgi:hypothetical protein
MSRAATHWDKHGNIFIKGLKTLISMCQSNNVVIHESHRRMSHRMSRMEESQHEKHTQLGVENPEPFVYPDLHPPVVADPWAWYRKYNEGEEGNDDEGEDEGTSE